MITRIKRNNGVFEAESRLWACYIAIPLYICGFVTLGAAFQKHLSVGALIMGRGIAELAIMINTVAVYAYCKDAFPKHQGEISALINLARTRWIQRVPWATNPDIRCRSTNRHYGKRTRLASQIFNALIDDIVPLSKFIPKLKCRPLLLVQIIYLLYHFSFQLASALVKLISSFEKFQNAGWIEHD